jgi:hypothetical protein
MPKHYSCLARREGRTGALALLRSGDPLQRVRLPSSGAAGRVLQLGPQTIPESLLGDVAGLDRIHLEADGVGYSAAPRAPTRWQSR